MLQKYIPIALLSFLWIVFSDCGNGGQESGDILQKKNDDSGAKFSSLATQLLEGKTENPFTISLSPVPADFYIPALHSFAQASFDGSWIIIGGQVVGFHGTSNAPPPFMSSFANDSMWVIDVSNKKSYGVPIPKQYWNALCASNPQFFQSGESLYLCGGYTVSDSTQLRFNTTSNQFFKINLPSFIKYVKNGGSGVTLDQVFPIAIQNDFVRISGGELFVVNDHFYLIGGQDYEGHYAAGRTGKYSNSIRSFSVTQNGTSWSIATMDSLVDPVNLHRRDFNLVPYVTADGAQEAILFGGVFTKMDESYNTPVYISGLAEGKPQIKVGRTQQNCNQYTCATASMLIQPGLPMMYCFLGGISYKQFDAATGGLVIGDKGHRMPFSKLVNFMVSDLDTSLEFVQLPPQPSLPAFLGSNACFIPLPAFVADGYRNLLDLNKVLSDDMDNVTIGYMYGGILSDGATSGTLPGGIVNTYANGTLYYVNLSFNSKPKINP